MLSSQSRAHLVFPANSLDWAGFFPGRTPASESPLARKRNPGAAGRAGVGGQRVCARGQTSVEGRSATGPETSSAGELVALCALGWRGRGRTVTPASATTPATSRPYGPERAALFSTGIAWRAFQMKSGVRLSFFSHQTAALRQLSPLAHRLATTGQACLLPGESFVHLCYLCCPTIFVEILFAERVRTRRRRCCSLARLWRFSLCSHEVSALKGKLTHEL